MQHCSRLLAALSRLEISKWTTVEAKNFEAIVQKNDCRSRAGHLYQLMLPLLMIVSSVFMLTPDYASANTETKAAKAVAPQDNARWNELKPTMFGERVIEESSDIISMEAPLRAHDAAVVPITINANIPQTEDLFIQKLHLVVDKNPLPKAGTFEFTAQGNGWASIETRIRINEYTNVRAIAELNDGSLHMTSKFVKAAGGCSAPALADMSEAMKRAGKMKLFVEQLLEPGDSGMTEAEIKISHPNNSGMQFDQVSRTYIPAFYVHTIGASLGGKEVIKVDTNFSMSENPTVRFRFLPSEGVDEMKVYAVDSKENRYEESFPLAR